MYLSAIYYTEYKFILKLVIGSKLKILTLLIIINCIFLIKVIVLIINIAKNIVSSSFLTSPPKEPIG